MPLSSSAIRATMGTLLLVPFLSGCGLLFVKGPVPGWETANADDLATFALTQPCTNSKTLSIIDGVIAGLSTVSGIAIFSDKRGYERETDNNANFSGTMSFVSAGVLAYSTYKGNKNVNDCRAFNARLLQERRGDAVGQARYEWLDESFPVPDFGVASQNMPAILQPVRGFSPAFSGSISNSPDQ
jgi:hypothetical protein